MNFFVKMCRLFWGALHKTIRMISTHCSAIPGWSKLRFYNVSCLMLQMAG